jgi:hypothetical protein
MIRWINLSAIVANDRLIWVADRLNLCAHHRISGL